MYFVLWCDNLSWGTIAKAVPGSMELAVKISLGIVLSSQPLGLYAR